MFKSFVQIYSPKYSQTLRHWYECRTSRVTVLRKHVNNSRLSGEKTKLSDIHMNVIRYSHECLTTVVRVNMKQSYICENVVSPGWVLMSVRVCAALKPTFVSFLALKAPTFSVRSALSINNQLYRSSVVQVSCDYRAKVVKCICKIRSKFMTLSHKCPFNETAT